jgi:hypothetical protein
VPIAKGEPWGAPGQLPAGAVVVGSDREASDALEEARRRREPFPALALRGGDLCRTLGGGGGERLQPGGDAVRFTVDLGEVLIDGKLHLFVAHLVARNRWWTRAFVALNAQWIGNWNAGPRAHPNDGLLDTYDVHLRPGQLAAVRSRIHHGAHLPHPGIKEKRTPAIPVELERPLPVFLDGRKIGSARTMAVRLVIDALQVFV